jgi:hypothetical protein
MKRYILFAGFDGLSVGGWHEYRGNFEEKDVAAKFGRVLCLGALAYDWWHVVDMVTGQIIEEGTAN